MRLLRFQPVPWLRRYAVDFLHHST